MRGLVEGKPSMLSIFIGFMRPDFIFNFDGFRKHVVERLGPKLFSNEFSPYYIFYNLLLDNLN